MPDTTPKPASQSIPRSRETGQTDVERIDAKMAASETPAPLDEPFAETADTSAELLGPSTAQVEVMRIEDDDDPDPSETAAAFIQTETIVAPPPAVEPTHVPVFPETTQPAAPTFDPVTNGSSDTDETPPATYNSEWVLTQDPDSYVIQFLGVRDRRAAMRFMAAYDLTSRSTLIELTHEGAPWYVLVSGHFPDRDAALAAINDLAPALAGLKPWARPIRSLKN